MYIRGGGGHRKENESRFGEMFERIVQMNNESKDYSNLLGKARRIIEE